MLVLTRKQQDQIQISDNIRITVLKIRGQSVRIGIEAPKNIRVVRGELTLFEDEPTAAPVGPDLAGNPVPAATPVIGVAAPPRASVCLTDAGSQPSTLQALVSRQRLKKRFAANAVPRSFDVLNP